MNKKNLVILILIAIPAAYSVSKMNFANKNALKESSIIFYSKNDSLDKMCCVQLAPSKISENSVYQMDADWIDENGREMKLSELRGRKIILTMFYASCKTVCPVMVSYMKAVENEIPSGRLSKYKFVLVTIDPVKDTPGKLRQYAKEHNLAPANWILLTGKKDDIATLAEMIGFNYKQNPDGTFSHANLITFLDSDGNIVHQSDGLYQNVKKLAGILKQQNL